MDLFAQHHDVDPSHFGPTEISTDPLKADRLAAGQHSMIPIGVDGSQNVFGFGLAQHEESNPASESATGISAGNHRELSQRPDVVDDTSHSGLANGTDPLPAGADGPLSTSNPNDNGGAMEASSVEMGRSDSLQGGPPATASTVVGSDPGDSKESSPRKAAESDFTNNATPSKSGDAKVALVLAVNAELFRYGHMILVLNLSSA